MLTRSSKAAGAVMAGLALASGFAAPAAAIAEPATTEVTIQQDATGPEEGNVSFTVPTTLPLAAKSDGTLIGPSANATRIVNTGDVDIRVAKLSVDDEDPFKLVDDASASDVDNAFSFTVNGAKASEDTELEGDGWLVKAEGADDAKAADPDGSGEDSDVDPAAAGDGAAAEGDSTKAQADAGDAEPAGDGGTTASEDASGADGDGQADEALPANAIGIAAEGRIANVKADLKDAKKAATITWTIEAADKGGDAKDASGADGDESQADGAGEDGDESQADGAGQSDDQAADEAHESELPDPVAAIGNAVRGLFGIGD